MSKKTVSRISPKINIEPAGISFEGLKYGDCFIFDKKLFIKDDGENAAAIDLETGEVYTDLTGVFVIPVDIKITWVRKVGF